MQEIEKLFRKITRKERELLDDITHKLLSSDHKGLTIKKLEGSDLYRLRKGRFRIIFHYKREKVSIVSIRLRNEKTYK